MELHQTPLLMASLFLCIGSASGLSASNTKHHRCPPSSCGNVQISYPFRLRGDEPKCGDLRYELTDVGLASGGCALPSNTLSLDTILLDERFGWSELYPEASFVTCNAASFMNCSRVWQRWCNPVPCLSGNNASVYVIEDGRVGDLAPSCRLLATAPIDDGVFRMVETGADVFESLQNGISLRWVNPSCDPVPFVVKQCYVYGLEW